MPPAVPRSITPAHGLLLAVLLCLACCAALVLLAVRQPWMGLSLKADAASNQLLVVRAEGPAQGLPVPTVLQALDSVAGAPFTPNAADAIEEMDLLDSYAAIEQFYDRQQQLRRHLTAPELVLTLADMATAAHPPPARQFTLQPAAQRPLGSLPAMFWFQLLVGAASLSMGVWVLVLRPQDTAVRLFAVLGAMLPLSAWSAAVYSTRELALEPGLLRLLSGLNHTGALAYGALLVNLFMSYPKRLLGGRHLLWAPLAAAVFLLLGQAQLVGSPDWGTRLPIALAMTATLALAWAQWRATRQDPAARAALRWVGLSSVVGCLLFTLFYAVAPMLGWLPPLAQGWSFGLFLLIYIGLAAGLRRWRLFDIDEWAYRLWLWVAGMALLMALDLVLVLALRLDPTLSLGAALLLTGLAYLPLRNALWAWLVERRTLSEQALSSALLDLSFTPGREARTERWKQLLQRLFEPLQIRPAGASDGAVTQVRLADDGLVLWVPAVAGAPAWRISGLRGARELFRPRHVQQVSELVARLAAADAGRNAYLRGVEAERARIARDLHDDLGARLMSALSQHDLQRAQQHVRAALDDMRGIVHALAGQGAPWPDLVAELRHESGERLAAAGLALDWPLPDDASAPHAAPLLPPRHAAHLASMVRELLSNAIRHAQATTVAVDLRWQAGHIRLQVRDDGQGLQASATGAGRGLANLRRRVQELQGRWDVAEGAPGTCITALWPCEPAETQAPELLTGTAASG